MNYLKFLLGFVMMVLGVGTMGCITMVKLTEIHGFDYGFKAAALLMAGAVIGSWMLWSGVASECGTQQEFEGSNEKEAAAEGSTAKS